MFFVYLRLNEIRLLKCNLNSFRIGDSRQKGTRRNIEVWRTVFREKHFCSKWNHWRFLVLGLRWGKWSENHESMMHELLKLTSLTHAPIREKQHKVMWHISMSAESHAWYSNHAFPGNACNGLCLANHTIPMLIAYHFTRPETLLLKLRNISVIKVWIFTKFEIVAITGTTAFEKAHTTTTTISLTNGDMIKKTRNTKQR